MAIRWGFIFRRRDQRRVLRRLGAARAFVMARYRLGPVGGAIGTWPADRIRAMVTQPALIAQVVSLHSFRAALELFDPVWEVLNPIERAHVLRLLIEQIDFNAGTEKIGITFRPTGVAALHDEMMAAQQLAAHEEAS